MVRIPRPWNEWLIIRGYDIVQPRLELSTDKAKDIIRFLVGGPTIDPEITGISY